MLTIIQKLVSFHRRLVQPLASHQTQARKEHIFYILIISNLYLAGVAALLVTTSFIAHWRHHQLFHGASPWLMMAVVMALLSLYTLAKQGRPQLAACLYLALLWLITSYTSWRWGVMLYQALLIHALIIIFTGILLSNRVSFITTTITSISLFFLTYFQNQGIIVTDQSWRQTPPNLGNVLTVSFTLGLIALFSWLSNQEISHALHKAQQLQKALQKERDALEIRVEERTQALKQAQLKTIAQAQRFAEMGKISSGLFHDIRNYLASLTIDLELAKSQQALATIKQINAFVANTQKQLKNETEYEWFSPQKEITSILKLQEYAAQQKLIQFHFTAKFNNKIYGPISVFHQIMINLISNAISAYAPPEPTTFTHAKTRHAIKIDLYQCHKNLIIAVTDHGCGMSHRQQKQVFNSFYSTKKSEQGIGLGLFLTKNFLEHHFQGEISVRSQLNKGSVFTVSIPLTAQTTIKKS